MKVAMPQVLIFRSMVVCIWANPCGGMIGRRQDGAIILSKKTAGVLLCMSRSFLPIMRYVSVALLRQ